MKLRSPGWAYRFGERVFRWPWGILILLTIALFAHQSLGYRFNQDNNLGRISALYLILPYFLTFPLFGIVILSLLKTRSAMAQTIHRYNLRQELSSRLITVEDWEGIVAALYPFITCHVPLAGLSLLVYNQISGKFEIAAARLPDGDARSTIRYIPLNFDGKKIALLYLYLFSDKSYPPDQINSIESLGPEIALAVERIRLHCLLTEKTRAIQKIEQDRIAKYLHDTIGHDLAYLRLKLDLLSNTGDRNGSAAFHQEIQHMHTIANNAFVQMRSLLRDLRDENHALPNSDLVSHIKECAHRIEERANFQLTFTTQGEPKDLPSQTQRQILYLIREILRNVEKHAHAQNAALALNWMKNGLIIKLSDDGQGFDAARMQNMEGHYGLKMVQEIVDELNGSLSLVSGRSEGTQITLMLPFN